MQAGSSKKKEVIPLTVVANVQGMGDVLSNSPADLIGSPGMRLEGISVSSDIKGVHTYFYASTFFFFHLRNFPPAISLFSPYTSLY